MVIFLNAEFYKNIILLFSKLCRLEFRAIVSVWVGWNRSDKYWLHVQYVQQFVFLIQLEKCSGIEHEISLIPTLSAGFNAHNYVNPI